MFPSSNWKGPRPTKPLMQVRVLPGTQSWCRVHGMDFTIEWPKDFDVKIDLEGDSITYPVKVNGLLREVVVTGEVSERQSPGQIRVVAESEIRKADGLGINQILINTETIRRYVESRWPLPTG